MCATLGGLRLGGFGHRQNYSRKPLVPPASLRASGPCEEAGFDKHLDDHAWTE